MAIATIDGVVGGFNAPRLFYKVVTPTLVSGRPQSTWGLAGNPGAGTWDNTLNGVVLSSSSAMVSGQIYYTNPPTGQNKHLARVSSICTSPSTIMLCDRLWHNGGFTITSTGAQSITSPAWPARDSAGSTNGSGVLLGVEVSSVTGAGTPTITIEYTNSDGTAGRTGVNWIATGASSPAGVFYPINLQAGDVGVRSVQSLTLSATWTSGTINLVAYRPLAILEQPASWTGTSVDAVTGGLPRLYDGSVPYIVFIPQSTTATMVVGMITYTEG